MTENGKRKPICPYADRAENLERRNEILETGQRVYDIDNKKSKIGDGEKHWNDLPWESTGGGSSITIDTEITDSATDINVPSTKAVKTALDKKVDTIDAVGKKTAEGGEIFNSYDGEFPNVASGNYSHAEGNGTQATGYIAHAEGAGTIASGSYSHAEGLTTKAIGVQSHAEGMSTEAKEQGSHAEGEGTIASKRNQHVQGQYNIEDTTTNGYAHIVGNGGADSARSNAHTLDWDGNAWYAGNVTVGGTYNSETGVVDGAKTLVDEEVIERIKYYDHPDIIPSDESYFTVNETGETIIGLKDAGKTQTELVIPYKINGKEITTLFSGVNSGQPVSILNGNNVITKVIIPKSVTRLGRGAFYYCDSLTSINIPDSVTSIGDFAFNFCTSLTSIDIPNSATFIGDLAFESCTSLTSVSIPNSVTSIGNSAFSLCRNLTIYCEQGSYAETYANTNNRPVIYTDVKPIPLVGQKTTEGGEIFNFAKSAGNGAHAEGGSTKATGNYSHSEGRLTQAIGDYTHTEGDESIASGESSHAEGSGTIASKTSQHVQGKYNIEDTTENGYAHIVGNGTLDKRSNAHTLDWNGNAWYAGDVKIGGTSYDDENAKTLATEDKLVGQKTTAGGEIFNDYTNNKASAYSHSEGYKTAACQMGYQITDDGWGDSTSKTYTLTSVDGLAVNDIVSMFTGMETINDFSKITAINTTAKTITVNTYQPRQSQYGYIYVKSKPAVGTYSIVSYSHAEGYNTKANGDNSHAEGQDTMASGKASHSEGSNTYAIGQYSHSEGSVSKSSGESSHAEGYQTTASGNYSHAEGYQTIVGTKAFVVDITSSSSTDKKYKLDSVAGLSTGDAVHFICGSSLSSLRTYSPTTITAIDTTNNTITVNNYTASTYSLNYIIVKDEPNIGTTTIIGTTSNGNMSGIGLYSHAEGYYTYASGEASHAEGGSTTASGDYSHVEGQSTKANGAYSHAEGSYTIAAGSVQHVQGRFNIEDTTSEYAHIVGNGTDPYSRSNAHTLDWNGNAWFAGNVTIGEDVKELATKEYVDTTAVETSVTDPIVVNTIYSLGEQSSLTIELPTGTFGNFIQFDFISGSTATTLSITPTDGLIGNNLVPNANTIYTLYLDWGIVGYTDSSTIKYGWRLNYFEYPLETV